MIPIYRRDKPGDLPGPIRRVSLHRVSNDRCTHIRQRLLRYILSSERRRVGAHRGLSLNGGHGS